MSELSEQTMQKFTDDLIDCEQKSIAYPNLTEIYPKGTVSQAYMVQQIFINKLASSRVLGEIIGYKAALTARPAQDAMNIGEAIIGVLFQKNQVTSESLVIDRQVAVETEFGYVTNTEIIDPVISHDVHKLISSYCPVVEIASPNLQKRPTGIDLISTNSATYRFIQGKSQSTEEQISSFDPLDNLTVELKMGDQSLHTESSGNMMFGQADALTWLINEVLKRGYPIPKGSFLMTGSIGPAHPAKKGVYQADFGDLGSISISI
mgnify:FL=1